MIFHIQIFIYNYDNSQSEITSEITLADIEKYTKLIKIINENANNNFYNWWPYLPANYDIKTEKLYLDYDKISEQFKNNFNNYYDSHDIETFFNKFTPNGTDRIEKIKIFKVEEIEL